MEQIDLESWEAFESEIKNITGDPVPGQNPRLGWYTETLFRGQADENWKLESTFDRLKLKNWSISDYFRLISRIKPEIETMTGLKWDIEDYPKLKEWFSSYENFSSGKFPAYEYLIFLRHHCFPSPLLDWSRSPYIAAHFAFSETHAERVAIFVYKEQLGLGKIGSSDRPQIRTFGPYINSHPRHFLQKSEYSAAARFKVNGEVRQWLWASHEEILSASDGSQDKCWKITLPSSERLKVLKILEEYNLTSYSLFQTQEALLKTIATRELELDKYNL